MEDLDVYFESLRNVSNRNEADLQPPLPMPPPYILAAEPPPPYPESPEPIVAEVENNNEDNNNGDINGNSDLNFWNKKGILMHNVSFLACRLCLSLLMTSSISSSHAFPQF